MKLAKGNYFTSHVYPETGRHYEVLVWEHDFEASDMKVVINSKNSKLTDAQVSWKHELEGELKKYLGPSMKYEGNKVVVKYVDFHPQEDIGPKKMSYRYRGLFVGPFGNGDIPEEPHARLKAIAADRKGTPEGERVWYGVWVEDSPDVSEIPFDADTDDDTSDP